MPEESTNPSPDGNKDAGSTESALNKTQHEKLKKRYQDAYSVAKSQDRAGAVIKGLGMMFLILGCGTLVFSIVVLLIAEQRLEVHVVRTVYLGIAGAVGAGLGILLHGLGITIVGQGQTLKASLDSAVYSSPFLSEDEKAEVLDL